MTTEQKDRIEEIRQQVDVLSTKLENIRDEVQCDLDDLEAGDKLENQLIDEISTLDDVLCDMENITLNLGNL